ncbi:MAG: protein phosphatase 2C domain-containing protein [Acidobacteriota bacterium]
MEIKSRVPLPRFPIYFVMDFSSQVVPGWKEAVIAGFDSLSAKLRLAPETKTVVWLSRIYFSDLGTTRFALKSVEDNCDAYSHNHDPRRLRAALERLSRALEREVSTGLPTNGVKFGKGLGSKIDVIQTEDWTPLVFLLLSSELAEDCASQAHNLKMHRSSPNIVGVRTIHVSEEALKRVTTVEKVILLRQVSREAMVEAFDWFFHRIIIACKHRGNISNALREVMQPLNSAQVASTDQKVESSLKKETALVSASLSLDQNVVATVPVSTRWREIEPTDQGDSVPHLHKMMLTGENGWRIMAATRRGKAHAHEGKYREDAFAVSVENGWHIAAIADGAGAYTLSRVGANRAVEYAIVAIRSALADLALKDATLEEQARYALQKGFEQAYKAVSEEAERRKEPLSNLASTLALLLHHPSQQGDLIAVVHVGDSLLTGWFEEQRIEIFTEADSGIYAGQSLFLTSQGIIEECLDRIHVITQDTPRMLLLMTDGVANDFYPYNKHLRLLFENLTDLCQKQDCDNALMDWLGYEKRGSFDDRTIIILFR